MVGMLLPPAGIVEIVDVGHITSGFGVCTSGIRERLNHISLSYKSRRFFSSPPGHSFCTNGVMHQADGDTLTHVLTPGVRRRRNECDTL